MIKKLVGAILLLGSAANTFSMGFSDLIESFGVGYMVGVCPILWQHIPFLAAGSTLPYYYTSSGQRATIYALGAAGIVVGWGTLGLAAYGADRALSHFQPYKVTKSSLKQYIQTKLRSRQ